MEKIVSNEDGRCCLDREDITAIEKAEDEFKIGKTISLKDIKKEISNDL